MFPRIGAGSDAVGSASRLAGHRSFLRRSGSSGGTVVREVALAVLPTGHPQDGAGAAVRIGARHPGQDEQQLRWVVVAPHGQAPDLTWADGVMIAQNCN